MMDTAILYDPAGLDLQRNGEGRNRTNPSLDHKLTTVLKTAEATRHPALSFEVTVL
jgi:hypothetical protein